jgi:hypothetical protein
MCVCHSITYIIQINGIIEICSFFISQCMSPTRLGYRELGLKLVSHANDHSHWPKNPSMVEERRDYGARDHFNMFLEESLMRQRKKNDVKLHLDPLMTSDNKRDTFNKNTFHRCNALQCTI